MYLLRSLSVIIDVPKNPKMDPKMVTWGDPFLSRRLTDRVFIEPTIGIQWGHICAPVGADITPLQKALAHYRRVDPILVFGSSVLRLDATRIGDTPGIL